MHSTPLHTDYYKLHIKSSPLLRRKGSPANRLHSSSPSIKALCPSFASPQTDSFNGRQHRFARMRAMQRASHRAINNEFNQDLWTASRHTLSERTIYDCHTVRHTENIHKTRTFNAATKTNVFKRRANVRMHAARLFPEHIAMGVFV